MGGDREPSQGDALGCEDIDLPAPWLSEQAWQKCDGQCLVSIHVRAPGCQL